jgi:hypothetical protein
MNNKRKKKGIRGKKLLPISSDFLIQEKVSARCTTVFPSYLIIGTWVILPTLG